MNKWFKVGKIVNTQGIKGEVRVISTTDFPDERFAKGSVLYLELPETKEEKILTVESHRSHKQFELLKFVDHPTINEVEKYKGGTLKVSAEQLSELEEDEFYYYEVIGCTVETVDGEEIGEIKEILSPGANDVWVIKRNGNKDLLIPYIEDVVKNVNIKEKRITIELLEGLE
jgi:16S rRNA processing protein RimM